MNVTVSLIRGKNALKMSLVEVSRLIVKNGSIPHCIDSDPNPKGNNTNLNVLGFQQKRLKYQAFVFILLA